MDSSTLESAHAGIKRKHSPNVEEPRPSAPAITPINYLAAPKMERLRLIEGDSETFSDVLDMIDVYEGVLNRHESLAANLGAKLVGPLILKTFEKLFESPIKVLQSSFAIERTPIAWLDVVNFSRTKPEEFILTEQASGIWSCRIWINGGQIEISEDDFRLITSGVPEQMISTPAAVDDERYELATLNILETRLGMLIKRADSVASKARQLNYHMKIRKAALMGRNAVDQPAGLDTDSRNFSPQPFPAGNARSAQPPNGDLAKLQSQLLNHYQTLDRQPPIPHSHPRASRPSTTAGFHTFKPDTPKVRRMSHPATPSKDGNKSEYRAVMSAKIEKLNRGDPISPPCDRCRRLKFDCTKHATACQACTKKHSKCQWLNIKEGELDSKPQASSTTMQQITPSDINSQTMPSASSTLTRDTTSTINSQTIPTDYSTLARDTTPLFNSQPMPSTSFTLTRDTPSAINSQTIPTDYSTRTRDTASLFNNQPMPNSSSTLPRLTTSAINSQTMRSASPTTPQYTISAINSQTIVSLPHNQSSAERNFNTSLSVTEDARAEAGNAQARKLLKQMAAAAASAAKRNGGR